MRFWQASFLLIPFFVTGCLRYQNLGNSNSNISLFSVGEAARCIRSKSCQQQFVVAHRANGFGAPENSREAVQKAIVWGVHAVEIDVRQSRDGKLFVLHDSSLDRTTNGTGPLREKSSYELALVRLTENSEIIPTFQDLYAITHGRATLFVDIKGDCVQAGAEWIAQNGSFDDIVFILNSQGEFRSGSQMKALYPDMMISAVAYSKSDILFVKKYFPLGPEIIDIGFPSANKYHYIVDNNQRTYISALVFEIGLPFLKPFFPLYIQRWRFNFLETNDPLFWMKKLPQ